MTKYDHFIMEIEDKNNDIYDANYKKINELITNKQKLMNIENLSNNILLDSVLQLNKMPKKFIDWLKDEILIKCNSNDLLSVALINLTYKTYDIKEKRHLYNHMNSLKTAGLIKNIHYVMKEKTFQIKLNNNQFHNIKLYSRNLRLAKKANEKCHKNTEEILRKYGDILDGCCVIFKDLFNNNHFHSFCVTSNNMVIDPAYNIVTDLDFYLKGLNNQILFRGKGTDIIKNIDNLKVTDKEFKKSKVFDFLKYAILQGEENNNNEKILRKKLVIRKKTSNN